MRVFLSLLTAAVVAPVGVAAGETAIEPTSIDLVLAEIDQVCHDCGDADCGDDCGDVGCCGPVSCCTTSSCCKPRFLAGAELSFIWSDIDGFRGSTSTEDVVNTITTTTANDLADGGGFTATPRLWLTHVKGCWGFTGRYWNFSAGDHENNVFFPPADRFGTLGSGNLDAFTIDLLAERYFGNDCRSRTVFFGVRHADAEASQFLAQTELIDRGGSTETQEATSFSRYRVDGTGPTFGLTGRRRLNASGWNSFYRVGGSILFGDGFAQSAASTRSTTTGTSVADFDANAGDDSATLYIFDLQLGVERHWALQCAPANAFFRVAGEYQYWGSDSDARAGASANSALTGQSTAASTAIANDMDLDLFGVSIGAGLTW